MKKEAFSKFRRFCLYGGRHPVCIQGVQAVSAAFTASQAAQAAAQAARAGAGVSIPAPQPGAVQQLPAAIALVAWPFLLVILGSVINAIFKNGRNN